MYSQSSMYLFHASKLLKETACCTELFSCGFFKTIRTKLCCAKFREKSFNLLKYLYYSNNTLRSPVVFRAAATFHVGLALEVEEKLWGGLWSFPLLPVASSYKAAAVDTLNSKFPNKCNLGNAQN